MSYCCLVLEPLSVLMQDPVYVLRRETGHFLTVEDRPTSVVSARYLYERVHC